MPLMRLVVCFDGRILYTVTVSSPFSLSALPVSRFHSPPFMPLTVCYFVLLDVLLLLFYLFFLFFPFLPRSVGPLRSRVSPFLLRRFSFFSPFPRFHLSLQHWYTNSRSKICFSLPSRSKYLYFPSLFLLRNSLTILLHRMPSSHQPPPHHLPSSCFYHQKVQDWDLDTR